MRSLTVHILRWGLPALTAAVAACGCARQGAARPQPESPGCKCYDEYHYQAAAQYFAEHRQAPHVDYALQSLRLGSAQLAAGNWEAARDAFADGVGIMDSFHTNTDLQKWTALVTDETVKVFKGEPYERAMAHYYLGLTYYRSREYDQAGACFRNALFKLKVYDEQNDIKVADSARSEFAIGWYLLGRSRQRLNDRENAQRCFQTVRDQLGPAYRWVAEPALNGQSNVLLVVETGRGPFKTPYGPSAVLAELNPRFSSRPLLPRVYVDGKRRKDPALLVALRHIAAKRKWQTLDTIRYAKGFLNSGAVVTQLQNVGTVSNHVAKAASLALAPGVRYDMRYWEMLPDNIFVLPMKLSPGVHSMKIVYRDTRDAEHPWHRQEWDRVRVPAGQERLLWVRGGPRIESGSL